MFSLPVAIIGLSGSLLLVGVAIAGFVPATYSLGFAAVFLALLLYEVREYFERTGPSIAATPRPGRQPRTITRLWKKITSGGEGTHKPVSSENPVVRDTVVLKPKESTKYPVLLAMGSTLIIEAGSDHYIRVELVSRTEANKKEEAEKKAKRRRISGLGDQYHSEKKEEGWNHKIEYKAARNGNWFVYVTNMDSKILEAGITLTIRGQIFPSANPHIEN